MKCSACGNDLKENSSFCTFCGAPVKAEPETGKQAVPEQQPAPAPAPAPVPVPTPTPAPAAAPSAVQTQGDSPQRSKLAVPLVIAVIVAVALVVVLVVVLLNRNGDTPSSTPTNATPSSISVAAPAPTIETALFRVSLPPYVASKVTFTETNNTLYMKYAGTDTTLAEIFPASDAPQYEIEYMYDRYELGDVLNAGQTETVSMMLPFLGENDSLTHWGNKGSVELGITKLLGLTPEEFAACIELKTGSGFSPSTPTLVGGRSTAGPSTSSGVVGTVPTSAFWGIWAPASKDEAEMEATAQRIRQDYGIPAFVVLTTDWSNLNSEPWYVVSLGQYTTQDAANDALSQVHQYYSDAYVKYSGDRLH